MIQRYMTLMSTMHTLMLPVVKIWTVARPKFGTSEQGYVMSIKKALYGLKRSGAAWRALFASTLSD
jgi:hypothetical protein